MLYRGHQFKTRPVEDILNDIDSMGAIKDSILSKTNCEGNFDMQAINQEYFSLPTDKERECYEK